MISEADYIYLYYIMLVASLVFVIEIKEFILMSFVSQPYFPYYYY